MMAPTHFYSSARPLTTYWCPLVCVCVWWRRISAEYSLTWIITEGTKKKKKNQFLRSKAVQFWGGGNAVKKRKYADGWNERVVNARPRTVRNTNWGSSVTCLSNSNMMSCQRDRRGTPNKLWLMSYNHNENKKPKSNDGKKKCTAINKRLQRVI